VSISYEFIAPRRILFGWGRRREVGSLGRTLGRRAFLLPGSRTLVQQGQVAEIAEHLRREQVEPIVLDTLSHEPEVADVDRTSQEVRRHGPSGEDFLLAVGGGASIDLAKAVAAMATNTESPTVRDYLEGVGKGLRLDRAPLPVLAMPTTAGTGTEATKNAVISSYDPPFKKSLRDERIAPTLALVDPELSVSCPAEVTAASGMDAITQLFESYLSRKAQPIPQALAIQGLQMAIPALPEAVRDGGARPSRERMAHAALLSGMALANSGLGMAHGVAPALGVHCRVPHGVACALMLPVALRVNRDARREELALLAHVLFPREATGEADRAIDVLLEHIDVLCREVGTSRRLRELGVRADQIPAIVAGSRGSSMSGNPVELSDERLTRILEDIL